MTRRIALQIRASIFAICFTYAGLWEPQAGIIFESASLGQTNASFLSLSDLQSLGARFHLDQTYQVEAIGGNITAGLGLVDPTIYGAIVPLNGGNAFPDGPPA